MKTSSKKVISYILIFALICAFLPAISACNKSTTMRDSAFDEEARLEVAVLADTHYTSPTLFDDESVENFPSKFSDTKTFAVSRAIIKSTIDQIIANGTKYILIAGDLCDRHDLVSHTELAAIFTEVEKTGVKIFVAPGNHDVTGEEGYEGKQFLKSSAEPVRVADFYNPIVGEPRPEGVTIASQFRNIYNNFGYSEAINVNGLNYVADLNEKYQLIVIDNCSVDLELNTIEWAKQQVENAISAGKTPIAMMHKPIDNMFGDAGSMLKFMGNATSARAKTLMNQLSDAGLKFVLSGHNHANNIAELKSEDEEGNEVLAMFDIMTSSLIHGDNSYKVLRFSDNYVVGKTLKLERVNESYLPSYLATEERNAVVSNLENYSYEHLKKFIADTVSSDSIKTFLSDALYGKGVTAPAKFDTFVTALVDFITKPFYKSVGGSNSVEALYEKYGATLPSSNYYNVSDLVASAMKQFFVGEESPQRNESLLQMIDATIKGMIVCAIDNGFFTLSDNFETVSTEVLNATCARLLVKGEFELLNSRILHNLLQLPIIGELNEMLGGLIAIPTVADTAESLGEVVGLLEVAGTLLNMELVPYFESETVADVNAVNGERKIYSGVFFSDNCLFEQLFGGMVKGLVDDSDVPDRNFVMDLRNYSYEKLD